MIIVIVLFKQAVHSLHQSTVLWRLFAKYTFHLKVLLFIMVAS